MCFYGNMAIWMLFMTCTDVKFTHLVFNMISLHGYSMTLVHVCTCMCMCTCVHVHACTCVYVCGMCIHVNVVYGFSGL